MLCVGAIGCVVMFAPTLFRIGDAKLARMRAKCEAINNRLYTLRDVSRKPRIADTKEETVGILRGCNNWIGMLWRFCESSDRIT